MNETLRRCATCGSLLDEEDLFCANCGAESPRRTQDARPASPRQSRDNFQCTGCGASMSYDPTAQSLKCPFCGVTALEARPDAPSLAPHRVVPFRADRRQAEASLRAWLGRGFWRPSGLAREAIVVRMMPVYVPYWVFSAKTHTYWTADTDQTPSGARATWYPLTGEHAGSYAGLLIGASGALTPQETACVCPFDLDAGVPADRVDLDRAIYERFTLPKKYARPWVQCGLEAAETHSCRQAYVPGNTRNVHANVRLTETAAEPVLLPVWIAAYRYRGRLFRFLVNGQTGRTTGQTPISWAKIVVAAAILVLGLLGLLAIAGAAAASPARPLASA